MSLPSAPNSPNPNRQPLAAHSVLVEGTIKPIYANGKNSNRLTFNGINEKIWNVAVKQGLGDYLKEVFSIGIRRFVPLKLSASSAPVLVNVSSLARNLGLTREAVTQAHNESQLEELVFGLVEEEKMVRRYSPLFKDGELHIQNEQGFNRSIGLRETQLRKVIHQAFAIPLENGHSLIEMHTEEGKKILVEKDIHNPKKITLLINLGANKKLLGAGGYGIVTSVVNIATGQFFAMKIAFNRANNSYAIEEIKNERAVLAEIHKEGLIEGIQLPPYRVVDSSEGIGFLNHQYAGGNLHGFCVPAKANQIDWNRNFYRLASGLQHLARKGYLHPDIKAQNILVRRDAHNQFIFDLADFGPVRKLAEIKNPPLDVYTMICEEDRKTLRQHFESMMLAKQDFKIFEEQNPHNQEQIDKNHEAFAVLEKKYIELQESRMVFLLGSVLKSAWNAVFAEVKGLELEVIGLREKLDEKIDDRHRIEATVNIQLDFDIKKLKKVEQLLMNLILLQEDPRKKQDLEIKYLEEKKRLERSINNLRNFDKNKEVVEAQRQLTEAEEELAFLKEETRYNQWLPVKERLNQMLIPDHTQRIKLDQLLAP